MNAHTPLPLDASSDPAAEIAAWGQGVLRRQVAMVEALTESALRMAQAIERRATEAHAAGADGRADGPADPAAASEAAMAFARVARAVRMASLLQSKLVKDVQALAEPPARTEAEIEAARAEAIKAAEQADPAYGHKMRVEKVVARLARASCGGSELKLDRMMNEAVERLEDEDLYGDVRGRPVGELVALICRDLGIQPNWDYLANEAWAKAEIAAGDPRSPFFPTSPVEETGPPAQEPMVEGASGVRQLFPTLVPDSS